MTKFEDEEILNAMYNSSSVLKEMIEDVQICLGGCVDSVGWGLYDQCGCESCVDEYVSNVESDIDKAQDDFWKTLKIMDETLRTLVALRDRLGEEISFPMER